MDEQKYLILDIRSKIKDITGEVKAIKFRGGLVEILFYKAEKVFSYARQNILFSNQATVVEGDVVIGGKISVNVKKKILFKDVKYIKLFYGNGSSELYREGFKILPTRCADILRYLLLVAELVKNLPSEEEDEPPNRIVANTIEKIQEIQAKTPLFSFLSGILTEKQQRIQQYLFPFQCNESQLKAVEQAFSQQLSMIQGPPGTGKTQTILNILMNAVIDGQRVAVVSNNNSAIQNVVEKLSQLDNLDFMVALLGNNNNVNAFLNHQPQYPPWLREENEFSPQDEQNLASLHQELKKLYAMQNELKKRQAELNSWCVEARKFSECYPRVPQLPFVINAERMLRLFGRCNKRSFRHQKVSFFFKLWQVFFCRHGNFAFWDQPFDLLLPVLKNGYYQAKHDEIKRACDQMEKQLAEADFEAKCKKLNALSQKVLKGKLRRRYSCADKPRATFRKYDLRTKPFGKEYPILLSTTFMIQQFAPDKGKFDLLVIDEASQVDLCTGIVALSCAENVVIVGDDKQLPCVITAQDEKKLSALNVSSTIPAEYKYHAGQSILSSLQKAVPDVPSITLREHYRSDPLIIGFCNQRFYDGELIVHTPWKADSPLKVIFTSSGNHARGRLNLRQWQEIQTLMDELVHQRHYSEDSIGICAPYRQQADIMNADTVHKYQGREKDVMIMATVDNQITDFVADNQLLNVAVSRAKKEFYLVVSSSNHQWENCIGDLVNYIRYYGGVREGSIISIFDCLYSEYRQGLEKSSFRNLLFDSPAEKIVYDSLTKIMRENDVERRYAFQMHIPLREIFRDDSQLSDEERAYLHHVNTHVDFLIYERFGKTPRFGIEVDGYKYHKIGTRQAERDLLKNSIFAINGLRLLRLATNDSKEEDKIRDFLFSETTAR